MTLWICVTGDGAAERVVFDTEDLGELYKAAAECANEVDRDADKYFVLDDYGSQTTYGTAGELLAALDRIMAD